LIYLLKKVEELEKEKTKIDINPEYHQNIIGHKVGVLYRIRRDFDVNIQLPKRDHPEKVQ